MSVAEHNSTVPIVQYSSAAAAGMATISGEQQNDQMECPSIVLHCSKIDTQTTGLKTVSSPLSRYLQYSGPDTFDSDEVIGAQVINVAECIYNSDACNQMISNSNHSKTHIAKKSHECDKCHQMFSFRSSLNRHKRIHSGVKSYVCKTCNKAFIFSRYLKEHMLNHTGEKPYTCDLCDSAFSRRVKLEEHVFILAIDPTHVTYVTHRLRCHAV